MERNAHNYDPLPKNLMDTLKPKNNFAFIILGILLILMSAIGGFYVGRRTSNPAPIVHKDYFPPTIFPTETKIASSSPIIATSEDGVYTSTRCKMSIQYPKYWKAQQFFITDTSEGKDQSCIYLTGPGYKENTDHREGMFISINRTLKGTYFKDKIISSPEQYIIAEGYITEPPTPINVVVARAFGFYTGFEYHSIGYESNTVFIFSRDLYIYTVRWPKALTEQYKVDLEQIISSMNFN